MECPNQLGLEDEPILDHLVDVETGTSSSTHTVPSMTVMTLALLESWIMFPAVEGVDGVVLADLEHGICE
jgi:hypothetical protein